MPTKKSRFAPYGLNLSPVLNLARSNEWRRQNADSVEIEVIKPESFLPVTTGSTGRSPICFTIKSVPHSRVDGRNIYVETKFLIEKYDSKAKKWVPTVKEDKVLPIANTACSIFEDLNVTVNGVLAENTQRDFAIKAYLQNLLFTTPSDRDTVMQSALLALDKGSTHKFIHTLSETIRMNPDSFPRRVTSDGSKDHACYGRLQSDVLSCDEPLPDTVTIGIKLFPAKSEACLLANTEEPILKVEDVEYRVNIKDCTMYVPRVTPKNNQPIERVFTYTNWKVAAYTHQSGQSNFKKDIAVGEMLPQKALVVFMPENNYNGSWNTNKLQFDPANASKVLMKCNQRHLPFMNGYQSDFVADIYHTAYVGLTTELGAYGHPIKYKDFDDGFCIFGFDLTPNKVGNIVSEDKTRGALELDVEFTPPPAENMMVILVLIYDEQFKISKSGMFSNI